RSGLACGCRRFPGGRFLCRCRRFGRGLLVLCGSLLPGRSLFSGGFLLIGRCRGFFLGRRLLLLGRGGRPIGRSLLFVSRSLGGSLLLLRWCFLRGRGGFFFRRSLRLYGRRLFLGRRLLLLGRGGRLIGRSLLFVSRSLGGSLLLLRWCFLRGGGGFFFRRSLRLYGRRLFLGRRLLLGGRRGRLIGRSLLFVSRSLGGSLLLLRWCFLRGGGGFFFRRSLRLYGRRLFFGRRLLLGGCLL